MARYVFVGCDSHDRNLVLQWAVDTDEPQRRSFFNNARGRKTLIKWLKSEKRSARANVVVFAYEASGLGYTLSKELDHAGIVCHIIPPNRMKRSTHERKKKNDANDALRLLSVIRNHYLANDELHAVWVPDDRNLDDRELTRGRADVAKQLTAAKAKVKTLLKRHGIEKPEDLQSDWTKKHRRWMHGLLASCPALGPYGALRLESLLRQVESIEAELRLFEAAMRALAKEERYAEAVARISERPGVSVTTAMVFLAEIGDPTRFANRRKLASFLGLVPSKHDSGEATGRDGHITKEGSGRVRHVLGQAVWAARRHDPEVRKAFWKLVGRKPKHRKIAVVALMRRFAIWMWHIAVDVYTARAAAAAPAS
jgi:transposase